MTSTPIQQTPRAVCPICHQTATKRVASLYETAHYHTDIRFIPPAAPCEQSYLCTPITWGIVIETLTLFAVMIICASNHFSLLAYCLAIVGICVPLILSTVAFRRMLAAEKRRKSVEFAWDEAMATWNRLRYCAVDDVVFHPAGTSTTFQPRCEQADALPALAYKGATSLPSVA